MLSRLLIAWGLMALCVVIHAFGTASATRWLRNWPVRARKMWHWSWLFVRLAGWIILLHVIEITAWALIYSWSQALPDLQSAFYFSAVTYTTTGYGDLVLPRAWQLVGSVEALTGILMCGWSTAFFFTVVSRMFEAETERVGPTP